MSSSDPQQGTPGWKIVLFVFLPLTAIVGSAFIFLAPVVTAKRPGHLYTGIRFNNEATVRFMTYNEGNPQVRVSLFTEGQSEPAASFYPARRGKNIFEVSELPDGPYTCIFQTPGFEELTVYLELVDGNFIADPDRESSEHALVMDMFVGVTMQEIAQPDEGL